MSEMTELSGEFDVTIPLHDVSKYASGDQPAEWLIVQGRSKHLWPGGWVYVRTEARLVGRVQALGGGYLEIRPERTGYRPGVRGPGPVVFVDPARWDTAQQYDLSTDRRFYGQGTRYVRTNDDGSLQLGVLS